MKHIQLNQKDQVIRGPQGIKLFLDASEIIPHDPGQGTPAMIHLSTGDTATFNCVDSELEVDGIALTTEQQKWVREIAEEVDMWLTSWVHNIVESV